MSGLAALQNSPLRSESVEASALQRAQALTPALSQRERE